MSERKIARTILVLGPRHSGKSVFSYLLFKTMRSIGDDSALVDCDYFSPTLRAYEFASEKEDEHVYKTAHKGKRRNIPISIFRSALESTLYFVNEQGLIVLDGLGRHTDVTEYLLTLTTKLFIVCRDDITPEELRKCGFALDGSECHPFRFYEERMSAIINIVSCLGPSDVNFDDNSLDGRLWGLRRRAIRKGHIAGIPQDTRDTVSDIAHFVLEEW